MPGLSSFLVYLKVTMDISRYRDELEAIVPGVFDAYEKLKTKNGMGVYTSGGAFYNHTFFGRDNAMAAKFVTDFDHQVTRETIIALASLQGTKSDPVTQEEPGRIHHEYRDFKTWHGGVLETLSLRFFGMKWGARDGKLLTYYGSDTTALYIRLVHKYVTHIDRSFIETKIKNRLGETFTLAESIERAADWLCSQVDENSHFVVTRSNDWALPYQTFTDGTTAFPREDGHLANYRRGITFTEVQAFVTDALEDTTHILDTHPKRHVWQETAHGMRRAFVRDFWIESDGFFGSSYDRHGLVHMPTVSAGWTLNTSLWDELSDTQKVKMVSGVVRKLFSDDFLTPVGLRTRSLHADQPLPGIIEYHGRLTVWPMFTFMVIEGLRRHRLHRLAEELENRVINGINASGNFEEFLVVDGGGHLLRNVPNKHAEVYVDAQMLPEKNIAFTVIPAMVLAYRAANRKRAWPKQESWQTDLENEILKTIEDTERVRPDNASHVLTAVVPTKFRRFRGNVRTLKYFLNERSRM